MARKDPFKTLDDPDPTGNLGKYTVPPVPEKLVGHWEAPAAPPSWLRRWIVGALLGWEWRE